MITVEKLAAIGADTEEGLARCCNSEALYLRLVSMIPGEACFDRLSSSLEKGDLETAFEAAHTLKGVLGNLSLTPLYELAVDMTEQLRKGSDSGCDYMLAALLKLRDELKKACED